MVAPACRARSRQGHRQAGPRQDRLDAGGRHRSARTISTSRRRAGETRMAGRESHGLALNRSPAELPVGCGGHPFPASNEPEASCSPAHRRLLLRRDPLRDRVVSAAALQLQLHGLPDRVWQRFCAEHAGRDSGFPHSRRRCEGMAPRVAVGRGRHVMVLRRVWRAAFTASAQGRPQTMNLRAGTLDDTGWLIPVAHLYTRSAQAWIQPAAGAECHALQAPRFQQRWRSNGVRCGRNSSLKNSSSLGNRLKAWRIGHGLGGRFWTNSIEEKGEKRHLGPRRNPRRRILTGTYVSGRGRPRDRERRRSRSSS